MDRSSSSPETEGSPLGSAPLTGLTVLDLSALGPGPFCSMLLADHGADVVSARRPGTGADDPATLFSRGKRSIAIDIRARGGAEVVRRIADQADVFIEGFRPGVMERRGLGPEQLLARNPRLVYTRLTGYGQTGPYAHRAGHDINYLALAGSLSAVGGERRRPPLNLLGDFAGGSLFAALRILVALWERERSGRGQVIDAAIVDGSGVLLTGVLGEYAAGRWPGRSRHLLSGAAPFYTTYRCADGRWFAVGALEPAFYGEMLAALGIADQTLPDRDDPEQWPILRDKFAAVFATEPRAYWEKQFADHDACGAPVLDIDELPAKPHLAARGDGALRDDAHPHTVLSQFGFSPKEIATLHANGAVDESP